ncbi:hypothetical protein F5888DRAFT_1799202 [Russula emetica]|nr:hypothetical protein F5888DRAFT_1799202 [Russula emetica]
MRAFSLVLVIVQIVAVALANRHYSPISGCQVTLDNYRFDLCPLLSQRNNSGHLDLVLHHQTPPTITTIVYNISLNGPLRSSDAISDDEQCISGAWACLTIYEHQPGPELGKDDREAEDIPIFLGVPQNELDSSVGHEENLGTYAELRGSVEDTISPSLSLHMHGGYYMNVPQKVQIDFECAESDDDAPKISGIWNNRHVLTWSTKYACARVHQTFLEGEDGQSNSPPEEEETNNPPEDSEESSPNQDLKRSLHKNDNHMLWATSRSARPPYYGKRIREIRRARFLQGTRNPKLIRWAAEECEMLGVDEYEADEMVNSRPLPDEEIPLRTGRTRPKFVNYGSAH